MNTQVFLYQANDYSLRLRMKRKGRERDLLHVFFFAYSVFSSRSIYRHTGKLALAIDMSIYINIEGEKRDTHLISFHLKNASIRQQQAYADCFLLLCLCLSTHSSFLRFFLLNKKKRRERESRIATDD